MWPHGTIAAGRAAAQLVPLPPSPQSWRPVAAWALREAVAAGAAAAPLPRPLQPHHLGWPQQRRPPLPAERPKRRETQGVLPGVLQMHLWLHLRRRPACHCPMKLSPLRVQNSLWVPSVPGGGRPRNDIGIHRDSHHTCSSSSSDSSMAAQQWRAAGGASHRRGRPGSGHRWSG